jgi:glycine hydroxymethyltransferase
MGLDLPHGGHLTHGFYTPKKKISATSIFFESMPYRLDEATGTIDYDTLDTNAQLFRPKIIIAGASAYSRDLDYGRFREICDSNGAYLMADMAHVSGLVAAGLHSSPFEHADVVTTTTHKSLRGPRGALIFYRRGERQIGKKTVKYDIEDKINFSVFPGLQGGPHNHTITALATALKQAASPDFVDYQRQVISNSKTFANALMERGYELVSGGTDNHLVLVDLRSKGIDGARVERVMELARMACNKNTVPGDKSALVPSGVRMGTPALTTRGFVDADFVQVAEFFDRAVQISLTIKKDAESRKLKDFLASLPDENANADILALRQEVIGFTSKFPTVGF